MNIFNKSIALCVTALSFANISAIDKDLDSDVHEATIEEVVFAPRSKRRALITDSNRAINEISKSQKTVRKALSTYFKAAASSVQGSSLRRRQKAFEQSAQNYCELLADVADQLKSGTLILPSFTTLNGLELVMVKGSKPSIFAPAVSGGVVGFGAGALIGGSLSYLYQSLAYSFGLTFMPAYAATALVVGSVGGILGSTCGLLGSFFGQPAVDEEGLEEAEEFAELISEKVQRAEEALIAQLR